MSSAGKRPAGRPTAAAAAAKASTTDKKQRLLTFQMALSPAPAQLVRNPAAPHDVTACRSTPTSSHTEQRCETSPADTTPREVECVNFASPSVDLELKLRQVESMLSNIISNEGTAATEDETPTFGEIATEFVVEHRPQEGEEQDSDDGEGDEGDEGEDD
jgi:hypothetical protein